MRSTPWAFWRVPRATPSGLKLRTVHTWTVLRRHRAQPRDHRVAGGLGAVRGAADQHADRGVRGAAADGDDPAPLDGAPGLDARRQRRRGGEHRGGGEGGDHPRKGTLPPMNVVIVGAGTFGASLAWTLARTGHEVTLVDQFEPGDARSSSGGESRLYRCSHGTQADYTRTARRAGELWRELEAESGEDLLVECGMAWFAERADGWEAESERTMAAQGIPSQRLDPGEAAKLFPSLGVDDLEFVLYEPEAGRAAGAAQRARAGRAGGRARRARGARARDARGRRRRARRRDAARGRRRRVGVRGLAHAAVHEA